MLITVVILPFYIYICGSMRQAIYKRDLEEFVSRAPQFSISDIRNACPEVPMTSVYAFVRELVASGVYRTVGRGSYSKTPKLGVSDIITPWMREVHSIMTEECIGVCCSICERNGNLYVEVEKVDEVITLQVLKSHFSKVISKKDESRFPAELEGYVVVCRMVSESPLMEASGIQMPTVEKALVDALGEGRGNLQLLYQKAFEQYAINRNRLARYASRRGLKEELNQALASLNKGRLELFEKLQTYFVTIPVSNAWVFGSFARGEETDESALDLLVSYDSNANVSLYNTIKYKGVIEDLFGRPVNLVEDGSLNNIALASANQDRYIIYQKQ